MSAAAPPPPPRRAPTSPPAAAPGDAPPAVEPLEVDAVVVTGAGTALWAVALVVLVLLRGTLDRHDAGWWIWVAVAGIGLGLVGLWITTRRRARLRAGHRVGDTDS